MLNNKYGSSWFSPFFNIKVILSLLIIVILILLVVLPLKLPFSISVPGQVFAAQEWIITKGRNGELITLLKDYRTGVSKSYSVTEFERGDNAIFNFNSNIWPGSIISKSDTIGSIFSNELEVRLSSLRGQLAVTNELLNSSLSGEKESIIQEAKDNLEFAKKRTEVEKKILIRRESLFEKGLISEEAYDSSKYTVELSEISIKIAEAQLQTAITGVKVEQIELIRSQIRALEKDITILEKRLANYNLTSPVNGYVKEMTMQDTLMVVSDTTHYIIKMPIPIMEQKYLKLQSNVRIILPTYNGELNASLERINSSVQYIQFKPVVFATAVTENSYDNLMPGLIVNCRIECGSIKIIEHIKRIFNMEML